MKPLTRPFPGQLRRSPLVAVGFCIFAILFAYKVADYILTNDIDSLALVGMAFGGGVIVVAILNNWRHGVYFFLGWLLFEDLARKFLSNNMAIYFAKDLLLAVVYLSFFAAYRRKDRDSELQSFRPPFLMALLVFVWFGVLQMFNPASSSIFYGILGMKLYFYYMPLVFLGYAFVNSEADLRRFFHVNLGLMLVIVALGIMQSVLGHTFLNPEHPAADIRELSTLYRDAPISGVRVYRPTSVFVSAGRFSDMLIVAWMMVFGFSGYLLLRHRRGRLFAFASLALTAAGCLMGASRGVFMWTLGSGMVGAAAFLWGAPWQQGEARRVLRTLMRAVLGVVLAVAVLLATYPQALLNRLTVYSETLDPRLPTSELLHRTRDYPWANFVAAFTYPRWPYGYGIGTVSLGGQYVTRIMHAPPSVGGVESGFGNLIVEMGIVGLLLWFVMAGAVVICSWRVVRKLRGSPWFPLAFMIFWYVFLLLLPFTFEGMQAYQDFVLNAYAWIMVGILFRLPKLALSAQFAATAPSPQSRFVTQPAMHPAARWTR
jgi:hypothetical protein